MVRPGPALPMLGEPEGTPRIRRSPVWLAMGFRPFFLAAALHAAVFVPWWLTKVASNAAPEPGRLLPMDWHAHEMLFGFTLAVVAGFLLTAVRNWTGRDTAHGAALGALLALWVAGRAAMAAGTAVPEWLAAGAASAFPLALTLVVGRVLVAARSRRNYGLVALLAALTLACALTHWGALRNEPRLTQRALHGTVHLIVLLNVIIGGRVIPLFTRTATGSGRVRNVAVLDRLALTFSAAMVAAVAAGAEGGGFAALAGLAGAANLLRMSTWGTRGALRAPLVLVLHLGYAWIGIGQLLLAAAAAGAPIPAATALHALNLGVIGTMTLGMMARVTLGHTGRPMRATRTTILAMALITLAALARLASLALPPAWWLETVLVSGLAFAAAFALFLAAHLRMLIGPRADGEAG